MKILRSVIAPSSRTFRTAFFLLALGATTSAAILACGSSDDERVTFDDTPEAEAPPPSLTTGDAAPLTDALSPCLTETLAAEAVPLAMLLVMDRSGSMSSPAGNTKWDQARRAMIAFADTPGMSDTKLGLTVFPPDPNAGDQCLPSSYAPIVPIAALPANAIPIKNALLARSTTGSTPMSGGLQGGIDAMKAYLSQNANEEGVIILVTDGDPGACTGDTVSNVTTIAQTGAKGSPKIRTFVVGMDGATFTNLDKIAVAGEGAATAFNASAVATDAGVTAQQQLLDALQKIRSNALGCEYVLPSVQPSKGVLDPDSVTIDFTPGVNDPPQTFRRVDGLDDCGATTGGFYYDDPANPQRIVLCPASCEDIRAGTLEAKLDVVLGCIQITH
ncbi:hypothetical protein AKJ09_06651 [Labilithrix luteola]|uniref:VWFA domain-containing protein n=1 Tax=Labilithrix luteola TaxID=1391654 RepID=A0A0K1Q2N2_9BACT|nr:vWA domain-containing protein [Labilithrix luteola]AKU99987.1 hypothetical protein AKJ09_06651 [Labilithrix luteola]